MSYLNTSTNDYPLTEQDIKNLFSNTSFTANFIPPENFVWVFPTPQPECINELQYAVEDIPVLTSKGHWEQTWKFVDRFGDFVDGDGVFHTKEEIELYAIKSQEDIIKTAIISQAKSLLDDTDYSGLIDVRSMLENIDEFDSYRSQLRLLIIDTPNVINSWPVKPVAKWKNLNVQSENN
jgi:hypothetical protein